MNLKKVLFTILFFIFVHIALAQNKIILQQGLNSYTDCEDTYLHFHSNDTSTTDVNHGIDPDIFIKDCYAWNEWARGAVKFDLSPVPSEEYVLNATYSMYFFQGEFTGVVCSLFIYKRSWDVSTATWNRANATTKWTTPGGDFKREFIAWTPFADTNTWESFDVTKIVREFLQNPDSNYGFFLKTGYNNIERRYYSSDYEVDSLRPKLTITTSTAITNKFAEQDIGNNIHLESVSKVVKFYIPFEGSYTISILNINGKQIYLTNGNQKKAYRVSLNNQSHGVYIIQVRCNNKFINNKFLLLD